MVILQIHASSSTLQQAFLTQVSEIIGDTAHGISGAKLVRTCVDIALEAGIHLPFNTSPNDAPNKRSAFRENLEVMDPHDQFKAIESLIKMKEDWGPLAPQIRAIQARLYRDYGHLSDKPFGSGVNEELIQDSLHWLHICPAARIEYERAMDLFRLKRFDRNVLDSLRLSFELALKVLLANSKPLEGQIANLGQLLKEGGSSPELRNMYFKLVDYLTKYQNTYVKHDSAVPESEVELIIELTSTLMKHAIRSTTYLR